MLSWRPEKRLASYNFKSCLKVLNEFTGLLPFDRRLPICSVKAESSFAE